eukprot:12730110-Alexandrium_andersonii.AAC.1
MLKSCERFAAPSRMPRRPFPSWSGMLFTWTICLTGWSMVKSAREPAACAWPCTWTFCCSAEGTTSACAPA